MAIAYRTVISFGLVAIPVAMYTAVSENDISFNQLHKDDHSRIKYKKVCAHCGKEVTGADIIKGYCLRQARMTESRRRCLSADSRV